MRRLRLFPLVFDIEYLGAIVAGASATIGGVRRRRPHRIVLEPAVEVRHHHLRGDRHGPHPCRYPQARPRHHRHRDKALQFPTGVQSLWNGPLFQTGATGTQLGVATVMAIVGPFHAGVWGANGSMTSERRPDATVDSQGPGTGMVQYLNRAAMGYVNGIDTAGNGNGFSRASSTPPDSASPSE